MILLLISSGLIGFDLDCVSDLRLWHWGSNLDFFLIRGRGTLGTVLPTLSSTSESDSTVFIFLFLSFFLFFVFFFSSSSEGTGRLCGVMTILVLSIRIFNDSSSAPSTSMFSSLATSASCASSRSLPRITELSVLARVELHTESSLGSFMSSTDLFSSG